MSTDGNVANLLGMARTAMLGGNQEEALTYFNRVLEIDPNVSDAWMGKGRAAGWQSSISNLRLNEAVIAFNHAIATAPEDAKEASVAAATEEINKLVAGLYGMSRRHLIEYAQLDGTWPAYLAQVSQMLDALDDALKWSPFDRTTLDNIVHLCKDNIEGYSFRDSFNNNAPACHAISVNYEASLRKRLAHAVEAIRASDPSYEAPNIQKKEADACFVVTATMGDFDHPDVKVLRRFRDEWIGSKVWGNAFVKFYYHVGPLLAELIMRSERLKRISYELIVKPAVKFAQLKLRA